MTIDLTKLVKPLEWHKSHMPSWNGDYHTHSAGYSVRCADEWGWKWSNSVGGHGHERSPEAAKAAANADHAARVIAALDQELLAELVGALKRYYYSGCPDCSGDCASANPPMARCLPQEARATLAKLAVQP